MKDIIELNKEIESFVNPEIEFDINYNNILFNGKWVNEIDDTYIFKLKDNIIEKFESIIDLSSPIKINLAKVFYQDILEKFLDFVKLDLEDIFLLENKVSYTFPQSSPEPKSEPMDFQSFVGEVSNFEDKLNLLAKFCSINDFVYDESMASSDSIKDGLEDEILFKLESLITHGKYSDLYLLKTLIENIRNIIVKEQEAENVKSEINEETNETNDLTTVSNYESKLFPQDKTIIESSENVEAKNLSIEREYIRENLNSTLGEAIEYLKEHPDYIEIPVDNEKRNFTRKSERAILNNLYSLVCLSLVLQDTRKALLQIANHVDNIINFINKAENFEIDKYSLDEISDNNPNNLKLQYQTNKLDVVFLYRALFEEGIIDVDSKNQKYSDTNLRKYLDNANIYFLNSKGESIKIKGITKEFSKVSNAEPGEYERQEIALLDLILKKFSDRREKIYNAMKI